MGSLKNPAVLLTMVGLLLTPILVVRRVPGALIIAIAVITIVGLFVPAGSGRMITTLPSSLIACPKWPASTFGQLDFMWLFSNFFIAFPLLFSFLCAECFSTLGALIAVTRAATPPTPDASI